MTKELAGWRILVAEDEYLVALDVTRFLEAAGARVVGPAPRVAQAMALAERHDLFDAAVLDINLAGETVYPVAARLMMRRIPVVFVTGYDETAIPRAYVGVTRCEKPVEPNRLIAALWKARSEHDAPPREAGPA
jgi:CheY-like chemotaxis protein